MKNFIVNLATNQKVICLLFLLGGGFLSCGLRYEIIWDFVNYHYYNAWALVNHRVNDDVLMAGLNGFFNPLPDVPLYYLIKYFNDFPALISFLQGLWFGALMYVVFRLEFLFFDKNSLSGKIALGLCFLIALTGSATFLQIGISSNEVMLAFLQLSAFYILINEIFYKQSGKKSSFFLSGCLLGAAMGLKLTAVIYCFGCGVTLLCFSKKLKHPVQNLFWFALGGMLGFLCFSGFWMWKMWTEFQNPFFPFANAVFESPFLPIGNFFDRNFTPQSWFDVLLWPIIISLSLYRQEGSEMFVADFRSLIVYLIFWYFIAKLVYIKIKHKKVNFDYKWVFLSLCLLVCYAVWMYFFSIVRYFILPEILCAFIIARALTSPKPSSFFGQALYFSFCGIVLFILLSTPYFSENWGRHLNLQNFENKNDAYIKVENVVIPDNALIKTYNYPTSALFAYWADKNPSVRGVNIFQQLYAFTQNNNITEKDYFSTNSLWQNKREQIIKNHQGPVLLLLATGFQKNSWKIDFPTIPDTKGMRCHLLVNNLLPFFSLCAPKEIADQVFVNDKYKIYEDDDTK